MPNKIIKQLSHASLSSNDLEKVKKFYVKILGFKIVHKFKGVSGVYGLFLYCDKRTLLEFFLTKKNKDKWKFKTPMF